MRKCLAKTLQPHRLSPNEEMMVKYSARIIANEPLQLGSLQSNMHVLSPQSDYVSRGCQFYSTGSLTFVLHLCFVLGWSRMAKTRPGKVPRLSLVMDEQYMRRCCRFEVDSLHAGAVLSGVGMFSCLAGMNTSQLGQLYSLELGLRGDGDQNVWNGFMKKVEKVLTAGFVHDKCLTMRDSPAVCLSPPHPLGISRVCVCDGQYAFMRGVVGESIAEHYADTTPAHLSEWLSTDAHKADCKLWQLPRGVTNEKNASGADVSEPMDADDSDLVHEAPLLAYLSPGRFSKIEQSFSFPFPAGMRK